MAQAGLLLPSEPLFIVDKSWDLKGNSKQSNKANPDLFAQRSFKVLKAGPSDKDSRKNSTTTGCVLDPANLIESNTDLRFVAANEPGGRQDQFAKKTVRKHARQHANKTQSRRLATASGTYLEPISYDSLPKNKQVMARNAKGPQHPSNLQTIIPGSSCPTYGSETGRDPTGLEDYLHYYRDVVAESAYPLQKYMQFEFNPIRGTCFPLALSDGLFLKTIVLVAAIHHAYLTGTETSKKTEALARRVLTELRSRIARNDVSDATVLSVSCIALVENLLGRHAEWRVHTNGMVDMIRLRGGVKNVDSSLRWKIYRTDLVGAVDHVTEPLLPHPGVLIPKHSEAALDDRDDDSFKAALALSGMSSPLQMAFRCIRRMTRVMSYAAKEEIPLTTTFYDDSCMQIFHDLLSTNTENMLDESWRVSGLIYMNTFIKTRPYAGTNSIVLSQKLRCALSASLQGIDNQKHKLWLAFIGGLISLETSDHEWFLQILSDAVRACGCTTWRKTRDVLSSVLWLDILHNKSGLQLWSKVSTAMM